MQEATNRARATGANALSSAVLGGLMTAAGLFMLVFGRDPSLEEGVRR